MIGTLKVGNPALMLSPPPDWMNDFTVAVSIPPKITIPETTKIATRAAGIPLFNRGRKTDSHGQKGKAEHGK